MSMITVNLYTIAGAVSKTPCYKLYRTDLPKYLGWLHDTRTMAPFSNPIHVFPQHLF